MANKTVLCDENYYILGNYRQILHKLAFLSRWTCYRLVTCFGRFEVNAVYFFDIEYWAAIFKGTNDHVTSTASKNQKLSHKEGFKNSETYEDGGIPCILPSKKNWGLKSGFWEWVSGKIPAQKASARICALGSERVNWHLQYFI